MIRVPFIIILAFASTVLMPSKTANDRVYITFKTDKIWNM